jgi:hypothetical protein
MCSSGLVTPWSWAPPAWPYHKKGLLRIGHATEMSSSGLAIRNGFAPQDLQATEFSSLGLATPHGLFLGLTTPQSCAPHYWSHHKKYFLGFGHKPKCGPLGLATLQSCAPQNWSHIRVVVLRIGQTTEFSSSGLVIAHSWAPQDWSDRRV